MLSDLNEQLSQTGPRKIREANLSATTLRVIGFLFLVAAAVVAILNLKRVADLGMMWFSPPLMIVGLAFVAMAARKTRADRGK